jgi:hypothetical protein
LLSERLAAGGALGVKLSSGIKVGVGAFLMLIELGVTVVRNGERYAAAFDFTGQTDGVLLQQTFAISLSDCPSPKTGCERFRSFVQSTNYS